MNALPKLLAVLTPTFFVLLWVMFGFERALGWLIGTYLGAGLVIVPMFLMARR